MKFKKAHGYCYYYSYPAKEWRAILGLVYVVSLPACKEFPELRGQAMMVYVDENPPCCSEQLRWVVAHVATSSIVSRGRTRKAAAEGADYAIRTEGPTKTIEAIRRQLAKIPPRPSVMPEDL